MLWNGNGITSTVHVVYECSQKCISPNKENWVKVLGKSCAVFHFYRPFEQSQPEKRNNLIKNIKITYLEKYKNGNKRKIKVRNKCTKIGTLLFLLTSKNEVWQVGLKWKKLKFSIIPFFGSSYFNQNRVDSSSHVQ